MSVPPAKAPDLCKRRGEVKPATPQPSPPLTRRYAPRLPSRLRHRLQHAIEYRLRHGWFARMVREAAHWQPLVFGPPGRVKVGVECDVRGTTMNVMSGQIEIGDYTFVGHNVSLLTGTHDHSKRDRERYDAVPEEGRDIVIGRGVWLASNCTVLGPCRIGDHAVIAAGALVTDDVPPGAIMAGLPARRVGTVEPAS